MPQSGTYVLAENVATMIEEMALQQWRRDITRELALQSWQSLAAKIRKMAAQSVPVGPSLGDCVSCDGYILEASEFPHCPTCARLIREGKPL